VAKPRYEVVYATYLGGKGGEQAREIIPYPDGSVLVGLQTTSTDMSVTPGVVQSRYASDDPAPGHPGEYGGDCFLAHLSSDGRKIISATYFGGSRQERNVYGMALDRAGNIIICSATRSPDLSTTPGCWRPRYHGGKHDSVAAKLSPDLTRILWCTYLGGLWARGGLAVDAEDNVYIGGVAGFPDFPTTPGALKTQRQGPSDSALVKLKPDGSGVVFSTLLGGTGADDTIMGVRVNAAGDIYVAGHTRSTDFPVTAGAAQTKPGGDSDCYLAKLAADGSRIIYATYLGGSRHEFAEHRLWLEPDGSVLLTGFTASPDFPTAPGAFQRQLKGKNTGFLTKLSPDGKRFVFSILFGGSVGEFWLMPTVDATGNIYIVGQTSSPDLPVTPDALQPRYGGGKSDGAMAIFSPDGARLLYCSYLGGSGDEMIRSVALGRNGEVYLVGHTSSSDFPATPDAVQTRLGGQADAFVVKLAPAR